MYRQLLRHGKEPPEFVDEGDSVRLVIRDGAFDRRFVEMVMEQERKGEPLGLDELLILSYLKRNRQLDRTVAARISQRTEREAAEVLARMTSRGLLERSATGRDTVYRLPAQLYKRLGWQAQYVRDKGIDPIRYRQMVLEYAGSFGHITNAQCRDLCGLNFHQATRLLAGLVREGALRREGSGRGARYVLR